MVFNQSENDGHNDGEENLVFHYKRNSFREREDEKTRNLASGTTKIAPGLFKSLVNTRGNRMMFFTLIAITVFAFIWGNLYNDDHKAKIQGVSLTLSAFSYGDLGSEIYTSLKLEQSKNSKENLPLTLEVVFYAVDSDEQISNKNEQIFIFDRKENQFLRAKFADYDIENIKCQITCQEKTYNLVCKIDRK